MSMVPPGMRVVPVCFPENFTDEEVAELVKRLRRPEATEAQARKSVERLELETRTLNSAMAELKSQAARIELLEQTARLYELKGDAEKRTQGLEGRLDLTDERIDHLDEAHNTERVELEASVQELNRTMTSEIQTLRELVESRFRSARGAIGALAKRVMGLQEKE